MIYQIFFTLLLAGHSASGLLLGSYFMRYGGIGNAELGYLFMIQPLTVFFRPLVCAPADRHQSHKQLLIVFLLITGLAYIPFIFVPYLIDDTSDELSVLPARARFWLLIVAHLIGCIGYCGSRALGDALTVNYSKRIGTNFARYRKYGSMSFGLCSYALGYINQGWIIPDFVPSFILWCACYFVLAALIHLWPDEYFKMVHLGTKDGEEDGKQQVERVKWPTGKEIIGHMLNKISKCGSEADNKNKFDEKKEQPNGKQQLEGRKLLTTGQQLSIFCLLIKRDFRIALYLLIVLYGGLVGVAGPNFVFTYLNQTCHQKGTCNAAELAGLAMIALCVVETVCYTLIEKLRGRIDRLIMLQVTFLSLAMHYYFFGFVLDSVSPYFFLIETLHGVEYSISLTMCVELGYVFGNEVGLLIPELIDKQIIGQDDDQELVKVALMGTMSGYFTFVYEGIGCILASFIFGQTIGYYSFTFTWILIGTLACIGFGALVIGQVLDRWLNIKPQILKTEKNSTIEL